MPRRSAAGAQAGLDPLEVGRRRRPMGDRHRLDEVLLEPRLDGGLDLLDAPNDRFDLAAPPPSNAISAPVPAALPAARTRARSQSGTSPNTIACSGSIWLPKAPAEPHLVDGVATELVHEQPRAGVERRLRQLDRADVVLGDDDAQAAARPPRVGGLVEHVAECAPVGDDPR